MAGKKHRSRNANKKYTSRGQRISSMKTAGWGVTPADTMLRKVNALIKGKDVVYTIENPNKNETNKRFIKVRVSGKEFIRRRAEAKIL